MENVTRYKCQMKGCPIVSTIEAPVCEEHLEHIGRVYMETRSAAGYLGQLRGAFTEGFARQLVETQARLKGDPNQPGFTETVYYLRIGDHVKIGTTSNLRARLRALYADHDLDLLLAVEPGGAFVERQRHSQFKDERVWDNRELFNPSPRLLEHVADTRERWGEPVLV